MPQTHATEGRPFGRTYPKIIKKMRPETSERIPALVGTIPQIGLWSRAFDILCQNPISRIRIWCLLLQGASHGSAGLGSIGLDPSLHQNYLTDPQVLSQSSWMQQQQPSQPQSLGDSILSSLNQSAAPQGSDHLPSLPPTATDLSATSSGFGSNLGQPLAQRLVRDPPTRLFVCSFAHSPCHMYGNNFVTRWNSGHHCSPLSSVLHVWSMSMTDCFKACTQSFEFKPTASHLLTRNELNLRIRSLQLAYPLTIPPPCAAKQSCQPDAIRRFHLPSGQPRFVVGSQAGPHPA